MTLTGDHGESFMLDDSPEALGAVFGDPEDIGADADSGLTQSLGARVVAVLVKARGMAAPSQKQAVSLKLQSFERITDVPELHITRSEQDQSLAEFSTHKTPSTACVTKARVEVASYERAGKTVEAYDQERKDGQPDAPTSPRPSAAPEPSPTPRATATVPTTSPAPSSAVPVSKLPYKAMVPTHSPAPGQPANSGAPRAAIEPMTRRAPAPGPAQHGATATPTPSRDAKPDEKPPELFPYQQEDVKRLVKMDNPILASAPGVGKTAVAITWAAKKGGKTLVVVPATLKTNWQREIGRFAPGGKVEIVGGGKAFASPDSQWVVTNYENLGAQGEAIKRFGFANVIYDEAHGLKDPDSQRTKAAMAINDSFDQRMLVTGTPVLNRPEEFKTLLTLSKHLSPAQDYWFSAKFMGGHMNPAGKWVESEKGITNEAELRSFVEPFFVRHLKSEVLKDLPPKLHTEHEAPLANSAAYKAAASDFSNYVRQTGGDLAATRSGRAAAFSKINALRQLAVVGKLPALQERLDMQRDAGQKSVVFSPFTEPLKEVLKKNPDAVILTGDESLQERQAAVDRFQNDPNVHTILLSPAGGVGITLTAADTIYRLGRTWTPAMNEQIEDRLHRIGQKRPVHVVDLHSPGTIDDPIRDLLAAKASVVNRTVEGKEGELDAAALQSLVSWAQRGSKVTGVAPVVKAYDDDDVSGVQITVPGRAGKREYTMPHTIKQRLTFAGLPIAVEQMAGQVRAWHDPHTGEDGAMRKYVRYGFVENTKGADGEGVDVFLGPNEDAPMVYVVTQMRAPDFERFDEEKLLIGFESEQEAADVYLRHYDDGRFLGAITGLPLDEFKARLARGGRIIKAEARVMVYA